MVDFLHDIEHIIGALIAPSLSSWSYNREDQLEKEKQLREIQDTFKILNTCIKEVSKYLQSIDTKEDTK